MPEPELDVMRRWVDTWNAGEFDAFFDLFNADAEIITDPSWMEPGPFNGRAAIRVWFEGLRESYEDNHLVLTELYEVGDRVLLRFDWVMRGRASGIESVLDATSLNTIDRGRIVRQQWYFDHADALEAAGRKAPGA